MRRALHTFLILGLTLLLVFNFSSCIKNTEIEPETPVLPPVTMEGKNTFGCLIGEAIMAVPFGNSRIQCEYYFSPSMSNYGTFVLIASSTGTDNNTKSFSYHNYENIYDTGVYEMSFKKGTIELERQTRALTTEKGKFNCQKDMYGKIHITNIDTLNKFISGIFEFDAVNEDDPKDTIQIRKGRFDSKFIF